jgi:tetratricopeptide (TPR) repeat protein
MNRHDIAVKCYLSALEIDSSLPIAYYNIGYSCDCLMLFERAIEFYIKAISVGGNMINFPEMPFAYNNIGADYMDLSKYELATQAFAKALQLKPDFQQAYNNLMICKNRLRR